MLGRAMIGVALAACRIGFDTRPGDAAGDGEPPSVFEHLTLPAGGSAIRIAVDGSDLWIGADVLRHFHQGTWTAPTIAGVAVTSIAIAAGGTILVSTYDAGVSRSTDGVTFVASNAGLPDVSVDRVTFVTAT